MIAESGCVYTPAWLKWRVDMTHANSTAVSAEPTDVRFSTRSMLVIMAVTAVAATALGSFLRCFPAEAQLRLWIWWGSLIAVMAAIVAISARLRFRAEKKAGRVLFQLAPHSYFFPKAPRLAACLIGALLLASAPAFWVFGSFFVAKPNPKEWTQMLNWGTFYSLVGSGSGMTYLWWHGRIRLAENGVVIRHEFVPWQNCKSYYWDACYPNILVMQLNRPTAVCVPAETRDAVTDLLKAKLGDDANRRLPSALRSG
jgi:hypothetical protein